MPASLNLLSKHFFLTKLHFVVQLHQNATLPAFKGAMWHGLFGWALKAQNEKLYQIFYAEHDFQQPKPYTIVPSTDHKTDWKKNELINFELTLFGDACQMAQQVADAWINASKNKQLGIGEQKVPFTLLSVSSMTPMGLQAGIHSFSLADWLTMPCQQIRCEMAWHFLTPVRIKHDSKPLKYVDNSLPLDFFTKQIQRRLTGLSRFWVIDREDLFADIYQELHIPAECEITSHCYYEDWKRYSTLHQKQIPYGGVKGQISFYGDIAHLAPLFKIGELLHIGGKTTFGLGKYQLIF